MCVSLKEFYNYKAVFLEWSINKSVNAEVEVILKQFQEKWNENLNAKWQERLTTATRQKEKDDWKTYIEHKRKEYVIDNLEFNFLKIVFFVRLLEKLREFRTF